MKLDELIKILSSTKCLKCKALCYEIDNESKSMAMINGCKKEE
jgi:hypothetical protein